MKQANNIRIIRNETFPSERALYGVDGVRLIGCSFDGEEDGESALKEASRIDVEKCRFNLRYPLWHDREVRMNGCELTEKCRAALWYSEDIDIKNSILGGIKALRECKNVKIRDTKVISPEFGWRSRSISVKKCEITGEYPFLMAGEVDFSNVRLSGKYSFQYAQNVTVTDSFFDTKDSFWHAKNVTVRNSVIKGEYLAWYSDGLTLDRCKIIGTQPLCYCANLRLIDCEMIDADFSFEYSDVDATVRGNILSVKNPLRGRIVADNYGEILLTADSKYPCECEIVRR